jgi:hypothetical protein
MTKFSDLEIEVTICPTAKRWPDPNDSTIGWGKMHAAVDGLRSLLLGLDGACHSAEADRDLSSDGIARRKATFEAGYR